MLYKHFTEKLFGLQDIDIEKIEEIDNSVHLFCQLKRKPHKCPCCGKSTYKVHDYHEQIIKDIPVLGKQFFIHLKKRRYRCTCSKCFAEENTFLPRYHRMTKRLPIYH